MIWTWFRSELSIIRRKELWGAPRDPGKKSSKRAAPRKTTKNAKGCFYADQWDSIGSEAQRRIGMNWLYLVGIIVFWVILNRWILPLMGVQT
jgi:hypothetical protein